MRTSPSILFLALALLGIAAAPPAPPAPATAPAARPNFVFIEAEAQGWSSTSVDMDGTPPSVARPAGLTPNIERLAADGMRFSDFYVSCPRCTPSRASWVTGISPAKLHMTYQSEGGAGKRDGEDRYKLLRMIPPTPDTDLPAGVRTTGALLHDRGYASAHFGKWHVGRAAPSAVGFDVCDGANSNQGPDHDGKPNPKQAALITDRGIEFMRAQVKAGKPFYLQLSHYGFGSEDDVTPESLAAAKARVPGLSGKPMAAVAGAREVDFQVGRVLAALKELGIAGTTYVFYGSDHGAQGGGGHQPNPPFSGAKGSVAEGGIRIPFIADGPGIKAGSVCAVRATNMDFLPTLLELSGKPAAKPEHPDAQAAIEGTSLVPLLRGGGTGAIHRPHDETFIHFPHYDLSNGGPASAVYSGDWKLVRNYDTGKVTLYEISKDRAEAHDVASEHADVVKELQARLDAYLKSIDAQMPKPNPDPAAANAPPGGGDTRGPGGKGGGGKGGKGGQGGNGNGGNGSNGGNGKNGNNGNASSEGLE